MLLESLEDSSSDYDENDYELELKLTIYILGVAIFSLFAGGRFSYYLLSFI